MPLTVWIDARSGVLSHALRSSPTRHSFGSTQAVFIQSRPCRHNAVSAISFASAFGCLAAHTARQRRQLTTSCRASRDSKVAETPPKLRVKSRRSGSVVKPKDSSSDDSSANRSSESQPPSKEAFPAHLRESEIDEGLQSGKLLVGRLRMQKNTCFLGIVEAGQEEYMVSGSMALNRAVDGDMVVVERLTAPQVEAYASAAKRLRHRVSSLDQAEDISEAESVEQALQNSNEAVRVRGKAQGRVVGIRQRTQSELAGSFVSIGEVPADASSTSQTTDKKALRAQSFLADGELLFVPADARFPYVLVKENDPHEGMRVAIVLSVWDRFSPYPRGKLSRVLGPAGDVKVETEMILMEHNVSDKPFSPEVMECLPPADFSPGPQDLEGRQDLRDLCVFSIDPPNCQDIDDALSISSLPNGNFKVGVHIADVTHFVHPDTAIDKEAAERCTSVYLVDRRVDMLPRLLTTDICSLRADGKDRLTFSAMFEMTPQAEVVSVGFCKSVIKSRAALSYKEAQARLESDPSEDQSEITVAIRRLDRLAQQMRSRRREDGALELESGELRFELDTNTQLPTNVFEYEKYSTCELIEEFMLLANAAVAGEINSKWSKYSILRRHPPPKADDMRDLSGLLSCFGIQDFKYGTNKELSDSLDKVDKPDDPFFNKLVRMMSTRCMNAAEYFCTGQKTQDEWVHFGLAMKRYTHFTSPIRRYADCLVHRYLAAAQGISNLSPVLMDMKEIEAATKQLNYKHKMSQYADRASVDFHLFLLFKNNGPVTAEGVVMRICKEGLKVAVEEYGVEGTAKLSSQSWLIFMEQQMATGRPQSKFDGIEIKIFDRAVVRIEADETDGRQRALRLTFLGMPSFLPDGSAAPLPGFADILPIPPREVLPVSDS